MYVFACVLDGLYAAVASAGGDGPLVVHRERRVLDATPEARARGVVTGMPLAEARSVLAEGGRFVEWQEEPYREASRRWLAIVADYTDAVEPLRQHECLADLSGHPRPREAAARLEEALRSAAYTLRGGLAACRWVARMAARAGDPLGLAHADPERYVANTPVSSLPVEPDASKRLGLLGCRTAGDVARLTPEALRTLFGDRAHGVARAARGRGDAVVRPLFPEDAVAARYAFDSPPDVRPAIDAGLARIAGQIGATLRDLDASGRTVELFLEGEDAGVQKIERTFARPLADAGDVQNALGLMLPPDLGSPIASVRARLPGVAATRRAQLDLQGGRSRADRDEGIRAALGHVRAAYGVASVRLVADIREPRWVRVRRAYRAVNGWDW